MVEPEDGRIYSATIDHLNSIFEIEKRCFPGETSYSKRLLSYLISTSSRSSYVECYGNVVRGFVIISYHKNSLTGHIETIDVDPKYQRKGIGLKLLEVAELDMKGRGMKWSQLEVSTGNVAALELYRKLGYLGIEEIRNYYRFDHHGTRDAVIMVKSLGSN